MSQVPISERLANLIIAGADKSGSTSLFWYLAQHGDICPSDVKETYYFHRLRYGEALAPIERYAQHFDSCDRQPYRLEATPLYLYGGKSLASGMRRVLGRPRVIILLRNPTERFWSYFNFVRSQARIPADTHFDAYLRTCMELRHAGTDHLRENYAYWALSGGFYADYVDGWLEVFDDDARIVFFDDLVRDPLVVVTEVVGWLRLDTTPVSSFDYSVENRTVQYRNRSMQQVALRINRGGEKIFNRHRLLKRALRSAYHMANASRSGSDVLSEDARSRLDEIYAESNAHLGRQLKEHGYGRLPRWLQTTDDAHRSGDR